MSSTASVSESLRGIIFLVIFLIIGQLSVLEVEVERDKKKKKSGGSSLGIELNGSPVKVTKLHSSSCFLGKLFVGDIIVSINNQLVATPSEFMKVARAEVKMKIKLKRDEFCSCKVTPLPSTKPNVECFEIDLAWRAGGVPIGILVYEDTMKRVIVSVVYSGTLAYDNIKPGDIVTKVNGEPVPDKATAKKYIFESVSTKQRVKLTVERSMATPSKAAPATTAAVTPAPPKLPNFNLPLPPDVLQIMDANRRFFEQLNMNSSILKRTNREQASPFAEDSASTRSSEAVTPTGRTASRTQLPTGDVMHEETPIEYDTDGKPLQSTPKRLGS